jgi:hypothetical protein
MVGESGPELEATGPSRIYSATDTARMLRGGGQSEMLKELQALRREVKALREESDRHGTAIGNSTRRSTRVLEGWEKTGTPPDRAAI